VVLSRALRAEAATSLKLAVVDAVTSACVCAQRLGQLPIPAHTPYNATSTIAQTVGHVAGGGWASTAGDVGHVVGESGGGGVEKGREGGRGGGVGGGGGARGGGVVGAVGGEVGGGGLTLYTTGRRLVCCAMQR